MKRPISIIGVPSDCSGSGKGCALAPEAIRRAGLVNALRASCIVEDWGDIKVPKPSSVRDKHTRIQNLRTLLAITIETRQAVYRAISNGKFPLVIGGDCSLLLGCLAAARRKQGGVGLLFLDGHEDAYPPHMSPTGEAADMELGFALGRGPRNLLQRFGPVPLVQENQVLLVGARDKELLNKQRVPSLIASSNVRWVPSRALKGRQAGRTFQHGMRALETIPGGWWFHLDLDVLSTRAFSAIDYPQPGGFSWRQLERVAETVLPSPRILGWNLTIYNPELDKDRTHANRIVSFLEKAVRSL